MRGRSEVIRRHRLPPPYRVGLTVLWIVPPLLFVSVIALKRGIHPALLDPRFLIPALLMIAPAFYFWQEGIDVLRDGIVRRIHVPAYHRFDAMQRWRYDSQANRRVLTIWDAQGEKILECRAGQLTDFAALLDVLNEHVP
jgi:hypothetical protein